MNTYAIVLYFDDTTNKIIGNMIERTAALSSNNYMLDINIPPHITLGCFFSDEQSDLLEKVESFSKSVTPFEVTFHSIGAFEPYVLFVSPAKDECLTQLNASLNESLLNDYKPAENANYLPDRWMPHCSLAVRLNKEQFSNAKAIEAETAFPFTAQVTKIVLAKCNPYNEVAIWDISKIRKD